MVLIFSGHSNKSEQVVREVQLATDCHLPIVRFRIEDVPLTDDLTYFLSTSHWLDALTPPLSKHIASLEMAVKELLGQSTEDASIAAASIALSERKSTQRESEVAATSPNRWKLLAIAAIMISVVVAALVVVRQQAQPGKDKSEATPSPVSPPAQTPALTPSPTVQQSPTPDPILVPPSPAAAGRRNNRPWKTWIDEFVHQYVGSSESNDVDLATSFFAPTVDLFDEGMKPLDSIRRDAQAYNARWPTRRATIRGDVQMSEKAPDRAYGASFEADYYVENRTRGEWISIAVSVDLQIVILDGLPRISSIKQKTLRREKGPMQPR